jgi:heat shock protein HslJ
MKRLAVLLVITGVGLALHGCESARPFERITWQLTALDGASVTAADERQAAYLHFDDGPPQRVTGSTGCNRLAGSYSLRGSGLQFGPLATTKMACADGMAQEQAFLAALAAVDGWRTLDRQVLELLDAQGEVLARFTAAPQP